MTAKQRTATYTQESDRVRAMFTSIAPRYDTMNTLLSGGTHYLWKKRLVGGIPTGSDALDLCTGTGDLLPLLAGRFTNVTGADFCKEMMDAGGQGKRFPMIVADAMALPFADGSFDTVTVSFGVRNFEDLRQGLHEIRRVLKSDGTAHILEFGQPTNVLWRMIFQTYSKTVMPFFGQLITGNRHAYEYLPETAKRFPCGADFVTILRSVGFDNITVQPLMGGIAYIYRTGQTKRL